jgi:hypothetical protein
MGRRVSPQQRGFAFCRKCGERVERMDTRHYRCPTHGGISNGHVVWSTQLDFKASQNAFDANYGVYDADADIYLGRRT